MRYHCATSANDPIIATPVGTSEQRVADFALVGAPKDTTGRGDITEIQVAAALMRSGRRVLRPISAGLRYDLLIDNEDGTYARVQCKTGVMKDGYIVFRVRNSDARRPNGVSYRGQIESFGVFCPDNGSSYLVPMSALTTSDSTARLRVLPPRNGQRSGIRPADAFEIRAATPRGSAGSTR
jgi:hypothetical protein